MTYDSMVDQWLGSDLEMRFVEWLYHVYWGTHTVHSIIPQP